MNIEKLVAAAKEIERLRKKSDEKTKAWGQLAADSRSGKLDRKEIERRRSELDVCNVVDFSSAIAALCSALHAR